MPRHPQPFYTGGPASTERVTAAMSAHRFAAVQAVVALEAAARGLEEAANTPSDPRTLPHFHGTPGVHAPIDQARVAAALDEILQELIPRVAAVAARLDTLRAPAEAR